MTTEEILVQWDEDSKINPMDLDNELLRLSKLHSKYVRLWAISKREARQLKARFKQLVALKTDYFAGDLNGTDELTRLGWEPRLKIVLKMDMSKAIDGDRDLTKLAGLAGEAEDCQDILESILKEIFSRSFNIRGALDSRKFEAGA